MAKKNIPVLIWKEGKLYVAKTIGLELASQGETKAQALANLQEALDLYLEEEGVSLPYNLFEQKPEIKKVYA